MKLYALLAATSFSLALAAPLTPHAKSIHPVGSRKIGLYNEQTGNFMGCATTVGLWTDDRMKCGDFIATRLADSGYSISTTSGDTCGTSNLDAFTANTGVLWHCHEGGVQAFWMTEKEDGALEKDANNPVPFYDYYRDRDDWRWMPRSWCCIGEAPPQQRT